MKKLSLLVTCYNRPQYLRQCLESIKRSDLSQVNTVLIIDDCSTDQETLRLINEFDLPGVELIKAFSKENRSIKGSLLFGLDILFNTCDVVTNLDADAMVTKDAFNRLLELHERFPFHIKTGFNCLTKNKDGSTRHKVLSEGDGYNTKGSVGGINMVFEKTTYLQIIKPALQKCLLKGGNWDHQACLISTNGYGREIICLTPSCVQHIGIESSMGHGAGGEPPDVADDFIRGSLTVRNLSDGETSYSQSALTLLLENVTLIAVDDNIQGIIKAADISCKDIEFEAVKLLSSMDSDDPRAVKIRHLGSKKEYSQFLLKEIVDYIDTPYFIVFQADGFILRSEAWTDDFLKYDMVGAIWHFRDHKRTANGGFSCRSKRLHQILKEDDSIVLTNDNIITNFAEDHNIFYIYREYLEEKYSIKVAPEELCEKFSIEAWGVKPPGNKYNGSFGFHGFNLDFSDCDLPYIPYLLPNRTIL